MSARVVPFRRQVPPVRTAPTAATLIEAVRKLATDTLNVRLDHPHCQNRMMQRGLGMIHVLEALRKGRAPLAPTLDVHGDWRIKIIRLVAGRQVQVIVTVKEDHLVVVTVI